jgi:hypothetical protein
MRIPSAHFNTDEYAGVPLCGLVGGLLSKFFSVDEDEHVLFESVESSERGEGTGLSISSGESDKLPINAFVISSSGSMECLLLAESQFGCNGNQKLGINN